MEQKKINFEPLTVGAFWNRYPNLIIIKAFLILAAELALLGLSLDAIIKENSVKLCQPPDDEETAIVQS